MNLEFSLCHTTLEKIISTEPYTNPAINTFFSDFVKFGDRLTCDENQELLDRYEESVEGFPEFLAAYGGNILKFNYFRDTPPGLSIDMLLQALSKLNQDKLLISERQVSINGINIEPIGSFAPRKGFINKIYGKTYRFKPQGSASAVYGAIKHLMSRKTHNSITIEDPYLCNDQNSETALRELLKHANCKKLFLAVDHSKLGQSTISKIKGIATSFVKTNQIHKWNRSELHDRIIEGDDFIVTIGTSLDAYSTGYKVLTRHHVTISSKSDFTSE